MDMPFLAAYWAPIAAAVIGFVVVAYCAAVVYRRSTRGQLKARLSDLRRCRGQLAAAQAAVERAAARLERLGARASKVKPRLLTEAEEALADARALQKIAMDQVLVAENQVRKVIVEEFPPRRHDALRRRYLSAPDARHPFTF